MRMIIKFAISSMLRFLWSDMNLGAWDVLKDLSEIEIGSSGRPFLTIEAQDERSGADRYASAYDL